ncbi:MAG: hypothetical protein P9M15_07295 [Candidatus Electryoneaceae bacterium]|nr:hypothetical protein [Candidatus Electryoneaceae bacterium]
MKNLTWGVRTFLSATTSFLYRHTPSCDGKQADEGVCLHTMKTILLIFALIIPMILNASTEEPLPQDTPPKQIGPQRTALSSLNRMNRVHRRSNIWMNFTNFGYFGNDGENRSTADDDPCRPGEWGSPMRISRWNGRQLPIHGCIVAGSVDPSRRI